MKEYYLPGKNKIYYKKNEFSKNKETIVFVHGLSGSSSAWIPYENKFKKDYNVILMDLRGHGNSFRPKNPEEYAIPKSSKDLLRLIEYEKLNDIILIGHSFGVLVVLDFLKENSKKLKLLILISPIDIPKSLFSSGFIKHLFFLTKLIKYFPTIKKEGSQLDYSKYIDTHDFHLRRMYGDIKNTGFGSFLNSLLYSYQVDLEELLSHKIDVPTLIVHGEKDRISPISVGEKFAEKIKPARLFVIKSANHILVLNYFDELSSAIEEFITNQKI